MPYPARMITVGSTTLSLDDWASNTGIPAATLRSRLDKQRWPAEKAVTEPCQKKFRQKKLRQGIQPAVGAVRAKMRRHQSSVRPSRCLASQPETADPRGRGSREDLGMNATRAMCAHCRWRLCCRPRGLCFACHLDPSTRMQHPMKDSPTNRRGVGNGFKTAPFPACPTSARPGSQAKVDVMAARVLAGEGLWHPLDGIQSNDRFPTHQTCEDPSDAYHESRPEGQESNRSIAECGLSAP